MDILNRFTDAQPLAAFEGAIHELDEIRSYTNTCLNTVSKLYHCVAPYIYYEDIPQWIGTKYEIIKTLVFNNIKHR